MEESEPKPSVNIIDLQPIYLKGFIYCWIYVHYAKICSLQDRYKAIIYSPVL